MIENTNGFYRPVKKSGANFTREKLLTNSSGYTRGYTVVEKLGSHTQFLQSHRRKRERDTHAGTKKIILVLLCVISFLRTTSGLDRPQSRSREIRKKKKEKAASSTAVVSAAAAATDDDGGNLHGREIPRTAKEGEWIILRTDGRWQQQQQQQLARSADIYPRCHQSPACLKVWNSASYKKKKKKKEKRVKTKPAATKHAVRGVKEREEECI